MPKCDTRIVVIITTITSNLMARTDSALTHVNAAPFLETTFFRIIFRKFNTQILASPQPPQSSIIEESVNLAGNPFFQFFWKMCYLWHFFKNSGKKRDFLGKGAGFHTRTLSHILMYLFGFFLMWFFFQPVLLFHFTNSLSTVDIHIHSFEFHFNFVVLCHIISILNNMRIELLK